MNVFEKILYILQGEMEKPKAFGWFHIGWIFLVGLVLIYLYKKRNNYNEKRLKTVLGIYGIIAFLLELAKQLIWSFNYNAITQTFTWDYQWYAAPFQFCTTPIFVCLICLCLKEGRFRKSLLSYIAYVTILGSIITILLPDSCFSSDILVNIHTMWLHCGSLVVSIYLLMTGAVKIEKQNLKDAIKVFLVFVLLAEVLNIFVYNSGILKDETFNMFYISPYFITHLPVFKTIQENVPFIIYLSIYILTISFGSIWVYFIARLMRNKKYSPDDIFKNDTKKHKIREK